MQTAESLEQLETLGRTESAAFDARSLILNEYRGVLSTHSDDLPGYPFGSIVPYCLDGEGRPVMLITKIAQHTKNIQSDPKVSLIISQSDVDDTHTSARVTWVGDAELIKEPEVISERYYSYFPQAKAYDKQGIHKVYNFDFYRINLTKARYIGGFGKAVWVRNELISRKNPLFGEVEAKIVNHMNEDHLDAIKTYCETAGIEIPNGKTPRLAGVNGEGIHVIMGRRIVFIRFPEAVTNASEARQQLVAMATEKSN